MQALVLHAVGDLRYERIPVPTPGRGEALVCVGFCGVCGSDIPRIFQKGTTRFPTVCGHEFSGVIESTGDQAGPWRAGDRVAVFPLLWCARCAACEQGRYVQCTGYDYLGSRSDGAFAEYVVAPVRNLLRVPESVPLELAAMCEPAAVALHALRRTQRSLYGSTVATFGAGPIGLIVAQWARAMGASPLVFDIDRRRIELARSLGLMGAYCSADEAPLIVVERETAGHGAHVAIEAAGVPAALVSAIECARPGGVVVVLGNPSADVTLPSALISRWMRREIDVVGAWNSGFHVAGDDDDWRAALASMASGAIDLQPLVTHRVPLSGGVQVLRDLADRRGLFGKVLIQPDPDAR